VEAHLLEPILIFSQHDLGWDITNTLVSPDKRFEIDGAFAARAFIEAALQNGTTSNWDEVRKQLVWDAIALHTTPTISAYKQPEVALITAGVDADVLGPPGDPTGSLTWDEYNRVKDAFPRLDLGPSVIGKICGFARSKPNTTYGKR
jgi:hypothetical protein